MRRVLNFAQGTGLVHVRDNFGNVVNAGGISPEGMLEALDIDAIKIKEVQDKVYSYSLDTSFDLFTAHFDHALNYIDSRNIDTVSGTLENYSVTALELIDITEALIKNLNKLLEVDLSKLSSQYTKINQVMSGLDSALDGYGNLRLRMLNLRNSLLDRLYRLKITNGNFAKTEALAVAASGLSKTHGDYLKLQALISQTENKTSTLDALAQESIDDLCNQLAKLAAKALDLDIMERKLSDLSSLQSALDQSLEMLMERQKGVLEKTKKMADSCAELDEFVKCLIVYESQFITAGKNVTIEKEDKVFKINAITPPVPPAPKIAYGEAPVKPTIKPPPPPTTTKANVTSAPIITAAPDPVTTAKPQVMPKQWQSPFGASQNFVINSPTCTNNFKFNIMFSSNRYTTMRGDRQSFVLSVGAVNKKTGKCFVGETFTNKDLDHAHFEEHLMASKMHVWDWVQFEPDYEYTECSDYQVLSDNYVKSWQEKGMAQNPDNHPVMYIMDFESYISKFKCTPTTHPMF